MKKQKRVLAVFAGDAMQTFTKKGELKPRYYNAQDVFDEIHYFTFVDKDEPDPVGMKIISGRAKWFVHPMGNLQPWHRWTKVKRVIDEVRRAKPDVVRAYTPSLHGYLGAKAAQALNLPFVISLHAAPDFDWRTNMLRLRNYNAFLRGLFYGAFTERQTLARSTTVIGVYKPALEYAWRKGVPKDRSHLIYNRVDLARFHGAKPLLPKLANGRKRVLCVGRLNLEKSPEPLIRALALLPATVSLSIVGDGPQRKRLEKLVDELGLRSRVEFLGWYSHGMMPRVYASADVFCLPLKAVGIAIPILEAFAAGVPVVAGHPPEDEAPELTRDAALLSDNSPKSLANAITRVLSDEKLRKDLIAKGKRVVQAADSRVSERREADIYRHLLHLRDINAKKFV